MSRLLHWSPPGGFGRAQSLAAEVDDGQVGGDLYIILKNRKR